MVVRALRTNRRRKGPAQPPETILAQNTDVGVWQASHLGRSLYSTQSRKLVELSLARIMFPEQLPVVDIAGTSTVPAAAAVKDGTDASMRCLCPPAAGNPPPVDTRGDNCKDRTRKVDGYS